MATLYNNPTQNNLQYTLNSAIGAGDSSLTLSASVAGVVQAPGVFVIDRVDSAGNKTASVREYISFTGVNGAQLTGLTRGLAGSTGQAHNVGAIVEFVPDVTWANALYNVITQEHGVTGQHLSLASVTHINTQNLIVPSLASIRQSFELQAFISSASINNLFVGQLSQASIQNLAATNSFTASGASLMAIPLVPTWIFGGTTSGASANLGFPISMPYPGTIQYIDATTRIGSSNASLFLDITKNGAAILNATASQSVLLIPINGTYVSTASIATAKFVAGDVFNFSIKGSGSMAQDLVVKLYAR